MSSLKLLLDLVKSLDSLLSRYYNTLSSRSDPFDRHLKESEKVSSIGKDGFQVCMDVQQFKPNELSVKVVDNEVVVEGKHEEREEDQGFISWQFIQPYALPKDYDSEKLVSTLSSDGVLTLSIPQPAIEQKPNEKVIEIQQTGPAHLNVNENAAEEQSKDSGAIKDKRQSR